MQPHSSPPASSPGFALTAALALVLGLTHAVGDCPGQAPTLVADTNTTPVTDVSSDPSEVTLVGGQVYLAARTIAGGNEPYFVAGGISAPLRLRDLAPGIASSNPRGFTAVGSRVLFHANRSELWSTDGTLPGTVLIKNLDGEVRSIAADGARAFIPTETSLWVSDGTPAGTNLLASYDFLGNDYVVRGNRLFYFAKLGGPWQLWVTDGTTAGTSASGNGASWPRLFDLVGLGSGVVYRTSNHQLWVSDGTTSGTRLLVNFDYCEKAVELGKKVYFFARPTAGPAAMWETDGTAAGTVAVAPLPGASGWQAAVMGNVIYLATFVNQTVDLWKSDGTAAGTTRFASHSGFGGTIRSYLTPLGPNAVLFRAADQAGDEELWFSDGSSAGTRRVLDLNPTGSSSPGSITQVSPTRAVFAADDGRLGRELWITDGTAAGTQLLGDIQPPTTNNQGGHPVVLGEHAGLAIFRDQPTRTAWATDGTPNGTQALGSLASNSYLTSTAALGRTIFFPTSVNGQSVIMKSDGTPTGTQVVTTRVLDVAALTALGGHVYFSGYTVAAGRELWRTDGTDLGTTLVADLQPASSPNGPANLHRWRDLVFFVAPDPGALPIHSALYRSDGTSAGTYIVARPGLLAEPSHSYVEAGGRLFVTISTEQLWVTDGTTAGTSLVLDSTNAVIGARHLVGMGGVVIFRGLRSDAELWRSDGTRQGTYQLKDIRPGPMGSNATPLAVLNGLVYFAADDGVNGQELWRTDGTSAGTIMVKDINPGPGGIHGGEYVRRHAVVGDGLYFAADDGVNGQELWRTDGTAAGTTLVADLWPGPSGSKPSDLTLSRGALLFTADDGRLGAELWKIEVPAHTQVMGRGCTLGAVAPELTATPPQLGASLTIAGARAPTGAGVGGVLIISTRVARPVHVGNGCSLFVDLTAPFAEVTFLPDPTGRWSIGVTVPNTAALHGLLLPAQAGIGPTTNGPFGVDLTNGLFLAVRR